MGTWHRPITKNVPTVPLNTNTIDNQYPRKGLNHSNKIHNHDYYHHYRHSDDHIRDGEVVVLVGMLGGGGL